MRPALNGRAQRTIRLLNRKNAANAAYGLADRASTFRRGHSDDQLDAYQFGIEEPCNAHALATECPIQPLGQFTRAGHLVQR